MVRQGIANLGTNVLVMVLALGTGTLLARSLGPHGRGQLSAVMVIPAVIAIVAEVGCSQAITYEQARDSDAHRWLVATWLLILLPVVLVSVAIGELVLRVILAHQGAAVERLGAFYLPIVAVNVLGDVCTALLVGDHHFKFYNALRIGQPVITLLAYLALAAFHRLTVTSALVVTFAATMLIAVAALSAVVRWYGIGRPNWQKGRSSLWYGFRAHGTNVSLLINGRLDQLLLPAFVGASSLGLYAVAVSVSSIVFYVAAPLAVLVLPAAARRKQGQPELVRRATQASFLIAGATGLGLAVAAEPAVTRIYGATFVGSVHAIWWLIPGSALYVAGYTLWQGLYAVGKPLLAATAQAAGFVVTAVGLLILLPRGGGIIAAAIISSVAYGTVMVVSLLLYCRVVGLRPRLFLKPGGGREEPPSARQEF